MRECVPCPVIHVPVNTEVPVWHLHRERPVLHRALARVPDAGTANVPAFPENGTPFSAAVVNRGSW
jgi:hypothetical protein